MMSGVLLHHGRHLVSTRHLARSTIIHSWSFILGLETSYDNRSLCDRHVRLGAGRESVHSDLHQNGSCDPYICHDIPCYRMLRGFRV